MPSPRTKRPAAYDRPPRIGDQPDGTAAEGAVPPASAAVSAARPASETAEPWQIAAALVSASSLDEQLALLMEAAPRVGGADTATIFLRDEVTGPPRAIVRYGYELQQPNPLRPRGITEHVLATGGAVVVENALTDPRVNPVVPAAGVRSFVALPLLMRGIGSLEEGDRADGTADGTARAVRPMGVLYVNARRPGAFDARTVEALKGLAALAAVTIENSRLLAAQRETAAQLQEALRLREQFVSAASHELKTPLTPLKGYAQAIRRRFAREHAGGEPVDRPWLGRALGIMLDQVNRIDTLVTDLLDVSRLRAGHFSLTPEAVDLVDLAREAVQRFRDAQDAEAGHADPEAAHTVTFSSATETLPGFWDPARLDQVLTNLLGNAVKYSPEGGQIEVRVEPGEALDAGSRAALGRRAPAALEAPGWAHLSVHDEGIGLPHDEAAREALFEPFSRGENAMSARVSGFGLGLYICAEVTRRHGGVIWGESAGPNQGTTVHVLLPPKPPEPD